MTEAGGEREHLAVGAFAACGVITDGPQDISNGQRSEGRLGHGRHTRVGHIPHGPDVESKVVTDDCPLHPDIGDRGVRGVLDRVGRVEGGISTQTSQCQSGGFQQRVFQLAGRAHFL